MEVSGVDDERRRFPRRSPFVVTRFARHRRVPRDRDAAIRSRPGRSAGRRPPTPRHAAAPPTVARTARPRARSAGADVGGLPESARVVVAATTGREDEGDDGDRGHPAPERPVCRSVMAEIPADLPLLLHVTLRLPHVDSAARTAAHCPNVSRCVRTIGLGVVVTVLRRLRRTAPEPTRERRAVGTTRRPLRPPIRRLTKTDVCGPQGQGLGISRACHGQPSAPQRLHRLRRGERVQAEPVVGARDVTIGRLLPAQPGDGRRVRLPYQRGDGWLRQHAAFTS